MQTKGADVRLANLCLIFFLTASNPCSSLAEDIEKIPPIIAFKKSDESIPQRSECNFRNSYNELKVTDIVEITLCSSPLLHKGTASIQEQVAARGVSASRYWPTLAADISGSKFQKAVDYDSVPYANYALSGKSGSASLSLNWILFDSGLRKANFENTSHLVNAAYFDRSEIVRNTIISATEIFYKAQSAAAAVMATKESG